MEKEHIAICIILVAVLIGVVVWQVPPYIRQLSVYSYAKSVPIQIGYDEVKNYWVLSSVVSETTAFKLVLEEETTESADGKDVTTQSETGILINPLQPYSQTGLTDANIQFERRLLTPINEKAPAFDINDAGWLTTAVYELGVYKNGVEKTSRKVEVDYQKERVIQLETNEGTVTVNNLGILPQGVEVPSGDLVVVYDPDGNKHVWNKANLIKMVDDWNNGKTYPSRVSFFEYSWKDVWDRTNEKGWLPQDVQLVHVSKVEVIGTNQQIKLTYSGIAFAGMIGVFVPDDLADTVVVQLLAPKPSIYTVSPDPLPAIAEGKSTVFHVGVRNVGTAGEISISASSTSYSIIPLTPTFKHFEVDAVFTFKFEAFALNVEKDVETTVKIFAQGRGGSDERLLKGKITNVEGYTPPIPDPTYTTLIIHVVDGAYEPVSDITVTVEFGGNSEVGVTNVDGDVQFDLSQYTGDVKITTRETSLYPSVTEIIKVQLGTNEHIISLGADWWMRYWWLVVIIVVAVVAIAIAVWWSKTR